MTTTAQNPSCFCDIGLYMYITEIMCPYPMENSIEDLTGDEQSTARGVIASFECAEPYYYSYGDIAKLFRCNSDGIWEEVSSSRTDVRCVGTGNITHGAVQTLHLCTNY